MFYFLSVLFIIKVHKKFYPSKLKNHVTNVTPKTIEKETSVICHCTEIFKLEHELQGCGMYIVYIYRMKLQ